MDGSDLKLLTPEYAHHNMTFSPDYSYFVDSYSTPVTPPITVLRDMDGKLLVKLEEANISKFMGRDDEVWEITLEQL